MARTTIAKRRCLSDVTQVWTDRRIQHRRDPVSEKWFVQGRFDWGLGQAIEFNLSLGVGYQFGKTVGLTLDYRWLDIDYADGGGDRRFKFDGSFSGPVLALTFQF